MSEAWRLGWGEGLDRTHEGSFLEKESKKKKLWFAGFFGCHSSCFVPIRSIRDYMSYSFFGGGDSRSTTTARPTARPYIATSGGGDDTIPSQPTNHLKSIEHRRGIRSDPHMLILTHTALD